MKLELRVRHLRLDPAFRETVTGTSCISLGRLEEQIRRVQLWIEDLNGPRGGRDIRCCLRICLRRGGVLTVEAVDAVPQVAVARRSTARGPPSSAWCSASAGHRCGATSGSF